MFDIAVNVMGGVFLLFITLMLVYIVAKLIFNAFFEVKSKYEKKKGHVNGSSRQN